MDPELFSFNELAENVKKKLEDAADKFTKDLHGLVKFQSRLIDKQEEFMEKMQATFLEMRKTLKSHDERLTHLTEINNCIDETLSNVLLAIRQNEYLQAWYCAQKGHPAMKVVGRHPEQAKRDI